MAMTNNRFCLATRDGKMILTEFSRCFTQEKTHVLQDIFVQKSPLVTHVMSRIIKKILSYMSLRFLHLHFVFADILSNLLTLVSPFLRILPKGFV